MRAFIWNYNHANSLISNIDFSSQFFQEIDASDASNTESKLTVKKKIVQTSLKKV